MHFDCVLSLSATASFSTVYSGSIIVPTHHRRERLTAVNYFLRASTATLSLRLQLPSKSPPIPLLHSGADLVQFYTNKHAPCTGLWKAQILGVIVIDQVLKYTKARPSGMKLTPNQYWILLLPKRNRVRSRNRRRGCFRKR